MGRGVETDSFTITDADGIAIHVYRWLPHGPPRATVQISHGWAEHARRYGRVGKSLAGHGCAVYAQDHRGHGRTGEGAGGLGDLGPGGMEGALAGVHGVTDHLGAELPGVPLFLLGHSWGSFLAQRFVRRWGNELAGLLLTGTTDESVRRPAGDFNAGFEPARTRYEWLSRDEAEVDRYIGDPFCGFERMQHRTADLPPSRARLPEASDDNIPVTLPVLVLNGSDDPVGGEEGGRALADRYRRLGLRDVTLRVYPGARHELFNEINRGEVIADVLAWLDTRI